MKNIALKCLIFKYYLYLRQMNTPKQKSSLFQQRITLMLAMLLCLFVSSVEYLPQGISEKFENKEKSNSESQNQTFIDVAVDAVVPFVVSVSQLVLHFVSDLFQFEGFIVAPEIVSFFYSNQLAEILFELIISTKGP
jgi:hypothetical protein